MDIYNNQLFISNEPLKNLENIFLNNLLPHSIKKIKSGDTLSRAHSPEKCCYYIKSGIIKKKFVCSDGKEKVLFLYKTGCLLGLQNLVWNRVNNTSAIALVDTELYQFEFKMFYEYITNSPKYFPLILDYVFNMMVLKTEEVINLSFCPIIDRLTMFLFIFGLEHYQETSTYKNICIPFNNEELGSIVSASRNSISNAISELSDHKIIEKKRNRVIIINLHKLEQYIIEKNSYNNNFLL